MLRLARLPHSYEIGRRSAKSRNLDPEVIGRLFKQMAERAQRAVSLAAERAQVRCSFEVVRGSVIGQLLKALGGGVGATSILGRVGSAEASPSILLMQGEVCVFRAGKAVIVLDDEHFSANRLPVALDLADESCTEELLFVVVAESLINARRQVARVTEFLEMEGRKAQVKIVNSLDLAHFLALLENTSCGTLIFSACPKLTGRAMLRELVEAIDYPIFLICR